MSDTVILGLTMMKQEPRITVRLEPGLVERVKRQAESEHRNLSQVVRMLLQGWLKPAKNSKRAAA